MPSLVVLPSMIRRAFTRPAANARAASALVPAYHSVLDLVERKLESHNVQLEVRGVQMDEPLTSEHLRPLEDEVIHLRNEVVEQRNISFAAQQSLEALQDKYVAAHEELQATNEELQSAWYSFASCL